MNIAEVAMKRFTAKEYDGNKKIPEQQIKDLYTVLRNSPSSVNSQPWHFFIISSAQGKQKIMPAIFEFNHERITNASHIIVFCAKSPITEQHLQNLLVQEEQDGRFATADLKKKTDEGRRYFVGINSNTPEQQLSWESKQVYIALGNLMLAAKTMGIDSTPIEGFSTQKMDEILNLPEKGLASVVVASLGYHTEHDYNAHLPKSRLPEAQLFTFM